MLTVSDDAAGLIRTLAREADATAGSGLRITVDRRYNSLSMELAAGARPGDAVVSNSGTRVFLSAAAAHRLSRRTLRASRSRERSSFFLA